MEKDQFVEYSGLVNRTAENVFHLLESLLEWSRIQMSDGKIEQTQFDLSDLLDSVVELVSQSAQEKRLLIENQVQSVPVYADKNMVHSVVRNLLSNSIKFTDTDGKITIKATKTDAMVEVCVQDTGVGLNHQQISDLFKVDVKVSTKGTAGEIGTGLGLPLCKELIELNGGCIWIESHEQHGTSIKFTLMARKPE